MFMLGQSEVFYGKVSGFQPLAVSRVSPSWMFDRFLNASSKLILMSLYISIIIYFSYLGLR